MPTVNEGQEDVAFLIAAVRRAVACSCIRAVARASGISHGGIANLVSGKSRRIHATTFGKLRDWHLRQWTEGGDGLTPEVAAYLIEQVLAAIAPEKRDAAALELMRAVEGIYARHDAPRPAWLSSARSEHEA